MADQPLELRRINWSDCCAFTHIFRSFRMAIQPGKLGLALIGVILTFVWGWMLDGAWMNKYRPLPDELDAYWQAMEFRDWRESMLTLETSRLQAVYATMPVEMPKDLARKLQIDISPVVDAAEREIHNQYNKSIAGAKQDDVAEFESATPGYTLVDAHVAWHLDTAAGNAWELFADGSNLLDEEARVHTSFLKDVAPLPGRGVAFGVRAFF